jgi:hypothetical protein
MAVVINGTTGITAPGVETFGNGTALGGTTNPIVAMTGASTNYVQAYVVNNTNGTSSSADLVAYPSNGTDSHGWVDMGITSLAYADSTYTITGPNESYLFGSAPSGSSTTGNLVIATDNTGTQNRIQFYNNGFTQSKSATSATITQYGIGLGTAVASNGTGLAFPATQSASSDVNTLDDYEEGTFTPTCSTTTTVALGTYVKVGSLVLFSIRLTVTSNASSSAFTIAMPFAASSDDTTRAGGFFAYTNGGSANPSNTTFMMSGSGAAQLSAYTTGGANSPCSNFNASYWIGGQYRTA